MADADPYSPHGLSPAEAAARLAAEGPNELAPPQRRTAWRIAFEVAREPMFGLLIAAGVLYLLLGDHGEAAVLLVFVLVTVAITVVQERRSERALEALRDLSSPRALVIRDGQQLRIAGREVVRGDLLVLREGDRVAADATLIEAHDLQADESLLSGESLPVPKQPGAGDAGRVFAGTLLASGGGLARVDATGAATAFGRIGGALATIESPPTPLQTQIRTLVRLFSLAGLALSALVVLLYGLQRGDWLAGLLAGITLAMAMLPEEFVLILTVFMAMGAWRLSRQRVLTRRAAVIEALGAATVLATDKTGTLTENRMAVAELMRREGTQWHCWRAGEAALPPAFHALLEAAQLASEKQPFDPMDRALIALAAEHLPPSPLRRGGELVHEYGLAPERMAMTHVWRLPGERGCSVATKGAPEAVAALCRLGDEQRAAAHAQAEAMGARGLRVLAVAQARFEGSAWPADPAEFAFEWLGLVALADPLRAGVREAVQECREAGIRVLMLTGDHPVTARAIAAQAGIEGDAVHARVTPERKLELVTSLVARGEVVAMTGDGVNDAPALKAAHIGVAMGARGTDVAREAAALVLLDDDFGALVRAVRQGRRIHDNLRKAMRFVLAVHVPIAGLALLPLLLGAPPLFTPLHIALLELLIDPVCSIVFEAEAEEDDVMRRAPRDPAAPVFGTAMLAGALAQGALVLVAVAALHALLRPALGEAQARAAAFVALVACNVALILANRVLHGSLRASLARPNPMLWRMLAATGALLALVLGVPALRALFGFALPPAGALAGAGALALAVLVLLSAARRPRR